jgi:hypothetical protein
VAADVQQNLLRSEVSPASRSPFRATRPRM